MTQSIATSILDTPETYSAPLPGPRKLVRPRLPDTAIAKQNQFRRPAGQLLSHQDAGTGHQGQPGSQAEMLYFQKQIQAQTQMVFVLDDGEHIEGIIEWCDLHVIKVKHTTRTMIYKSGIKYLYKASEMRPRGVMKASGG